MLKVLQQSRTNRVHAPRPALNQYLVFTADIRDGCAYLFRARFIEDEMYTRRDPDWVPPVNEATKRKERPDSHDYGTRDSKD